MAAAKINTCLKVFIILVNLGLLHQYLSLAVMGYYLNNSVAAWLLKFFLTLFVPTMTLGLGPEFTMNLIAKAAPTIITISVILLIIYLVGLILACIASKKALRLYAILMGVLIAGQIVGIAYVLGNPDLLSNSAIDFTKTSLEQYNDENDEKHAAAVRIWNRLTTPSIGGDFCCGLEGYTDFTGTASLPLGCCRLNPQETDSDAVCNIADAQATTPTVGGCKKKITTNVDESKLYIGLYSGSMIFSQSNSLANDPQFKRLEDFVVNA